MMGGMQSLFFALFLLQPSFSLAQLLPSIIATATLYATLAPSIESVSDTVTSSPTAQQACFLPQPDPTSLSSLQNNNYSATAISYNSPYGAPSYTKSAPQNYTSSGGIIILAPPPSTLIKTKTAKSNGTTVATPRSTKVRFVSNTTTLSITNPTPPPPPRGSFSQTTSKASGGVSSSSKTAPTTKPPSTTTATGGAGAGGSNTGTATTAGGTRAGGRGDLKARVLTVWMAVALGGLGAGMMSWG